MIIRFAETDRLILRALETKELPRLAELMNVWDVARWLAVVPYPYTLQHAETFYADMESGCSKSEPEFYAMALKSDNLLMGGVGLHLPRNNDYSEGEIEIGYWLGRDYWGQGYMSEAGSQVINIGFSRPATRAIVATTSPDNVASQKVLRKIGMRELGLAPRNYAALRGDDKVIKWAITREEWEICMLHQKNPDDSNKAQPNS